MNELTVDKPGGLQIMEAIRGGELAPAVSTVTGPWRPPGRRDRRAPTWTRERQASASKTRLRHGGRLGTIGSGVRPRRTTMASSGGQMATIWPS
jgi:hypothetical protein